MYPSKELQISYANWLLQINKNPRYIATLAKYIKRPYIKRALLKNGDRTTKLGLKPQKKKAADSCQKEIRGFLIKQKKNSKVAKATKIAQLPVKKPLLTYSILLVARNASIYSLERTKLNKNSAVEIAVIETRRLQKRDLSNIISQTISSIKEGWDTLQTVLATNCQNIKSLKTEIKEL